jgi:hypothetical protein
MEFRTEENMKAAEKQRQRAESGEELDSSWEWLLEENIHRDLDRDEEVDSSWEEFLNGGGDA